MGMQEAMVTVLPSTLQGAVSYEVTHVLTGQPAGRLTWSISQGQMCRMRSPGLRAPSTGCIYIWPR
jgi:hypothetical protein